jgi:hypothetical protein
MHLVINSMALRGESDSKAARCELCRIIRDLESGNQIDATIISAPGRTL